jgi:hypothetical protein
MPKFNPATKQILLEAFPENAIEKSLPEEVIHYICAALEDSHWYFLYSSLFLRVNLITLSLLLLT